MKVLFLGNRDRIEKYLPKDIPAVSGADIAVLPIRSTEKEVAAEGKDAEYVVVDAIAALTAREIENMSNLKMIQSEGVAYNRIDCVCAGERGIPVCNQRGANAAAVAEHTVLLMLALTRYLVPGYQDVMAGRQIETKEYMMIHGIHELSEMKIGLIGFGAIAKAVAGFLQPFGPEVHYYCRHRADPETEEHCRAYYLPEEELLAGSDIVSIHVPVTPETEGMCGAEFFRGMKDGSYFINTARGEIVDNPALAEALISGKLIGAGLDTVAPEPVQKDNVLLNLPADVQRRIVITPHIAGVTSGFFRRAHRAIWENIQRVEDGGRPINIVNEALLK